MKRGWQLGRSTTNLMELGEVRKHVVGTKCATVLEWVVYERGI